MLNSLKILISQRDIWLRNFSYAEKYVDIFIGVIGIVQDHLLDFLQDTIN